MYLITELQIFKEKLDITREIDMSIIAYLLLVNDRIRRLQKYVEGLDKEY